MVEETVLKTVSPNRSGGSIPSLSAIFFWRVDRVVMCRFAKPRLSLIRYKGSTPLLSAMFVDEYNSVMRRVMSTSIHDKQIGALAEWIYALG